MMQKVRSFSLLALGALVACDQVGASTNGSPKEKKPDGPPAPIAVVTVEQGPISSFYAATATLEPEKTATVMARVSGIVESIAQEEGARVKEDEILLRIENDEYRLKVAQAAARAARLADLHQRLEGLVAKDLAPAEEYVTVKQDYASAQAEEELARLELTRTVVRAPFAGRLVARLVDVGRTVSNGTPLFELADLEPLIARVHVPSKELKRLNQGQPVELVVDSSGAKLTGKIFLVSPVIDPATGTVKVSIEIAEYPEGIRAGDFAEVHIVTERREGALVVPRIAVIEEQKERVIFVAKDGKAQRRVVQIGFEEGDRLQVLEGVEAGEQVVIKGQHSLQDGASIKILESSSTQG
jgi:membrane fusion protein (multidrug efflux system)